MNSFEEIFEAMKENLEISDIARKTWIDPITPVSLSGNVAVLAVAAPFVKQILEENYMEQFRKHLNNILGFETEIEIRCDEDSYAPGPHNSFVPIPELQDDTYMQNKLHDSEAKSMYLHTFDTFIEGNSNKLAYAACKSTASGQNNYNPLYIYSQPGLGKTHLLSAIHHEISKNHPEKSIIYVTSDNFFNEFVWHLKQKTPEIFKNKYRNADVLLVDDVQFFSGKIEFQQEMFNIFNDLHSAKKPIVFTSDRSPKEISGIEERLKTRFEWGLLADISVPEFETRLLILERKAKLIGLQIQSNILSYIADKLKINIRQLEGAIIKLNALSLVRSVPPTLGMAQDVVKEVLDEAVPAPVTVDRVITEVATIYGLTGEQLRSKKRDANISTARQIAIYVVHQITKLSYSEIGKEFGGRDHSTIVYAVNKVKETIPNNRSYQSTINDLIKNIGNMNN
jgi:chromosomal replication initiator protein